MQQCAAPVGPAARPGHSSARELSTTVLPLGRAPNPFATARSGSRISESRRPLAFLAAAPGARHHHQGSANFQSRTRFPRMRAGAREGAAAADPGRIQTSSLLMQPAPVLTPAQDAMALRAAAIAAGIAYAFSRPSTLSLPYAAGMAILFAAFSLLARGVLRERAYQARARSFDEMGDPDSRFTRLGGVHVHAKACFAPAMPKAGTAPIAAHCYHGFGANLYSFSSVQAGLARALGGVVSAHDMPGFGLTERPSDPRRYFLAFNGWLGAEVLDYEVQRFLHRRGNRSPAARDEEVAVVAPRSASDVAARAAATGEWKAAGPPGSVPAALERAPSPRSVLLPNGEESGSGAGGVLSGGESDDGAGEEAQPSSGRVRRVLIGHSLGSMCAALHATRHPSAVDALVLVAPAILALPDAAAARAAGLELRQENGGPAARSALIQRFVCCSMTNLGGRNPDSTDAAALPTPTALTRLARAVRGLLQAALSMALLAALLAAKPLVIALLRALVRSRDFWLRGLRQAYFDPAKVTDKVVDSYALPQLVRGWEGGLFSFLTARLVRERGDAPGLTQAALAAGEHDTAQQDVGVGARLGRLAADRKLPVLIIHGLHDRLVPASNSRRLAGLLPDAELVVIDACGHMPHEEHPGLFVELVADFCARRLPCSG